MAGAAAAVTRNESAGGSPRDKPIEIKFTYLFGFIITYKPDRTALGAGFVGNM